LEPAQDLSQSNFFGAYRVGAAGRRALMWWYRSEQLSTAVGRSPALLLDRLLD